MSNDPRTFWELLEKHPVKIPKIQRDYVQGRTTRQVVKALDQLLNDIEAALYSDKPLDLNFIYGKTDSIDYFLPIDGQQRLTTLFLLFVFGVNKKQPPNDEGIKTLQKFQYDTRKSTNEFIEQLLYHTGEFSLCDIEDSIKDQSWFRAEWESDPTVFSMLKVLDKIQKKFSDKTDLFERLTGNSITFHYQDTKGIGDEDDLYIKLNARGRLLSDFENLKSEIEEKLSGKLKESFSKKIDGEWRDFFWKLALKKKTKQDDISRLFDDIYIHFFHWFFYCRTLLVDFDDEKLREKTNYFRLDEYKIDVTQAIEEIETILDNLCEVVSCKGVDTISSWLFDCLMDSGKSITLESIVKFWAYVIRYKYKLTDESAEMWLRIEKHLIENSEYSNKNIFNAIRSINKINDFSENLICAFAEGKIPGDLSPINGDVIIEEEQKAKLILSSPDWKEAILSAESGLPYFNGQIGFLLDFSKRESEYDLEKFKLYHKKTAFIFDSDKGISDGKQDLFRRALLTFGEYSVRGDCFHFNSSINSLRGGRWRDLLATSNKGKRNYFKELLDIITLENGIVGQLKKFIQNFSLHEDWRYHFIKTDGVMEFMRNGMFKERYERILLIPNKYLNGRGNAEYRTYSLFCILKAKGLCSKEDYQTNDSTSEIGFRIPQKDIKVITQYDNSRISKILISQNDMPKGECDTVEEALSELEKL